MVKRYCKTCEKWVGHNEIKKCLKRGHLIDWNRKGG